MGCVQQLSRYSPAFVLRDCDETFFGSNVMNRGRTIHPFALSYSLRMREPISQPT